MAYNFFKIRPPNIGTLGQEPAPPGVGSGVISNDDAAGNEIMLSHVYFGDTRSIRGSEDK